MKSLRTGALLASMAIAATACGTTSQATSTAAATVAPSTTTAAPPNAPSTTVATTTTTTTVAPAPQLDLSFIKLPVIDAGTGHYEGWLLTDGVALSTGKFTVTAEGNLEDLNRSPIGPVPIDVDPASATTFVLTIEPEGDADPAPSDSHILAGDFVNGEAALTTAHPAALGLDFADSSGQFVLATPTDGDRTNNEYSGVWFLIFPGPTAGLALPELPAGWTYEGWTVIDGIAVTTGTFLRVDASDESAPYSGTVRTPNFPGEDYLQNAPEGLTFPLDLSGSTVMITLEPLAEDNPAPFDIQLLSGPVPVDAELEPVAYPLLVDGLVLPAGTATIK